MTSLETALSEADLAVQGRMVDASNATLRCTVRLADGHEQAVIYKPVSGERPLWDFPTGTLAHREVAAFELSEALGWSLVPVTVWREEGPAGAGMCQVWIDEDPSIGAVDIVPAGQCPAGWRHVLDARDGHGDPVSLVHANSPQLLRMAVFDVLANNADRKGGHVLVEPGGRFWAIDHGVTFSDEPKLRTVLWGWAGESLPDDVLGDVAGLQTILRSGLDPVDGRLSRDERAALRERVKQLLRTRLLPHPGDGWPAIPWPVF